MVSEAAEEGRFLSGGGGGHGSGGSDFHNCSCAYMPNPLKMGDPTGENN